MYEQRTTKKGKLIAIEGIDGSGKNTICALLIERLRKEEHHVETISFPRYGEATAAPVEAYLNETVASASEFNPYQASVLYAVDRSFARFQIRSWLDAGSIVMLDRYVASNAGHQGSKIQNPEERKRFLSWLYQLEYELLEIPRPAVNIILHLPADIAHKRKLAQREASGSKTDAHEKDLQHLQNAEATFVWLAARYPDDFKLIECVEKGRELTREEVFEKTWAAVEPYAKC